jgi:CMP-N,N'-diacetyllegionaminic acid synthase
VGILAVIPARGGSKGVPGKNIRLLGGLPLIAHSILQASQARSITRVVVSTDSVQIADVGRLYGAEVPFMRPSELADDITSGLDPLLHALRWLEDTDGYRPDIVVLLQPTSPFRTVDDIDGAFKLALDKEADAVVSVTAARHHPRWMKRVSADGTLVDFLPPTVQVDRRQDLEPVFALNGAIYLARTNVLRQHRTWYTEHTYAWQMPAERSLDLDTEFEFQLAELLLGKGTR